MTQALVTHVKSQKKAGKPEQRGSHAAADWIKIRAMRQLKNVEEPTRALIILLPSVSLTPQMAVVHRRAVWGTRVTCLC